ncbi:Pc13g01300, partial [Penicillium rubens Wisconsin 54-1255]
PAGAPEPLPTNTQESTSSFSIEDFQPRVTASSLGSLPDSRKRTRSGDAFTPSESTGRATTREVWRLIDSLKTIIHHQTTLIESTEAELQEVKHDQNVLRDQNENLHEEVRALRTQIEILPQAAPTRSWATVAASGGVRPPQLTHQRPDKDQNCVRISTQRLLVDPTDNHNGDRNTFGRYLPTDSANTHIRMALLSAPSTQYAEVAGIGTTKTGYVIRFKNPTSAEAARNNTDWLNELGNSTKLVKPRFGVVVHRTPTEDFDLQNASQQAIEKIMDEDELTERGFRIEEVAWLKKKDKELGKFASLGIWFDSAEGAEWLLVNGLLVGQ